MFNAISTQWKGNFCVKRAVAMHICDWTCFLLTKTVLFEIKLALLLAIFTTAV